jgi:hypothetical protein
VSRRLRKLEARIRELEAPAKELARSQAQKRISEGLVEYERLRQQLIPIDVYANGRLQQIEYATESELEAVDRQSRAEPALPHGHPS